MTAFDTITWKNTQKVKAVFSLKNPAYGIEQTINGLNLGYNTPEEQQVTDKNRETWLTAEKFDPTRTVTGVQVHGSNVKIVNKPGRFNDTDGFVTNVPGLALGIFVADCAAILLYDAKKKVVGACHAGWKGAVSGIVPSTIEKMVALGSNPADTEAFISPCISINNFEVGEEVATRFPETFVNRSFRKPHVDLKGFIKENLIESGLPESDIEISDECTVGNENRFYSYRREGSKSGRMMGVIMLRR
jgi:YfiH family protein